MSRPTFITLGPSGTCHENALLHYLEFQGIEDFDVLLEQDLLAAVGRVRGRTDTFLVQCSAHLHVHLVTERYCSEVFVIDTFLYPTKELALLARADRSVPRSLGIVDATRGYLDLSRFQRIVDEPSKPIVAQHLLEGAYDAGLTHAHHADEHPRALRLLERFGAVDTTWLVYGSRKRFCGEVIGQRNPWLFEDALRPGPEDALRSAARRDAIARSNLRFANLVGVKSGRARADDPRFDAIAASAGRAEGALPVARRP